MKSPVPYNSELEQDLTLLFGEQGQNIEQAAESLKVMAHPQRLRILCCLRFSEQTVQNLQGYTGLLQTTLSQHLSLLRSRGLVRVRRQANYSVYRMADDAIVEMFDLIKNTYCT